MVKRLQLIVLFTSAACGTSPEATLETFYEAAQAGDYQRQATLLTSTEANWGPYVLSGQFPDETAAYFQVDSIRRAKNQPLGDTILWEVWGTEPNWSRAPIQPSPPILYVAPARIPKLPNELSAAEISALPRITSNRYAWLTKYRGHWRITVQAEQMGPLMMANDSLDRCGWGDDPRPCRLTASRVPSLARRLRIYDTLRVTSAASNIRTRIGLLDSLTIERTGECA
jgi:hypothetical protein